MLTGTRLALRGAHRRWSNARWPHTLLSKTWSRGRTLRRRTHHASRRRSTTRGSGRRRPWGATVGRGSLGGSVGEGRGDGIGRFVLRHGAGSTLGSCEAFRNIIPSRLVTLKRWWRRKLLLVLLLPVGRGAEGGRGWDHRLGWLIRRLVALSTVSAVGIGLHRLWLHCSGYGRGHRRCVSRLSRRLRSSDGRTWSSCCVRILVRVDCRHGGHGWNGWDARGGRLAIRIVRSVTI